MMIVRHIVIFSLVVCSMTAPAKNDDAEWSEWGDPTTKVQRTRRTTTGFTPRTHKKTTTPSSSHVGVGTSATNLTDAMTTLLKNFSTLLTAADEYSAAKDCGDECLANIVRLELFTIASGNHFVLAPNTDEKIEQKQLKKANALGALWLDLVCGEDVGAILSNVTRETVARKYPTTTQQLTQSKMYKIMEKVFDKMDDAIEKDLFLSTMYIGEQQITSSIRRFDGSSADKKVYFSFDELKRGNVSGEALLEWSDNVNIRKFLIHKKFLEAKYSDGEDAVAVRSFLKVANELCCEDRMQKIYTSALDESARKFVVADYPSKVTKTFVDKITKAVAADKIVNEEWVKIKKKMLDETRITKGKGRRISDI